MLEKNQMSRDWKPSWICDLYLPNQRHIYMSQFICCNTVDQICLDPLLLEFFLKIIGILVARNFTRNFKRSRNLENVPTKTSSFHIDELSSEPSDDLPAKNRLQ